MTFKSSAIVLRRRPAKGADQFVDLFTPHEGLVTALMRSGAKASHKLSGHLLPYSLVHVMIGRGRLDHVAGVETIRDFPNLRANLSNLALAASVVELILADVSRGGKQAEFDLLKEILAAINDEQLAKNKKTILVRSFFWKFLTLIGWRPELTQCHICQRQFSSGQFVPSRGIICNEHRATDGILVSADLLALLANILKSDLANLAEINNTPEINRQWQKLSQAYYQAVFEQDSPSLRLLSFI